MFTPETPRTAVPLNVRAVLLPGLLKPEDVAGRTVVAFDVLRATTTITAALAAGVKAIHIYPSLDEARAGRAADPESGSLLLGETKCLKPADFDIGNSPGSLGPVHAGRVIHMATTNGTRALLAPFTFGESTRPAAVLAGALTNRRPIAEAIVALGHDVTLLCAGTDGDVAYEDILGVGSVLDALATLQALGKVNDAGLTAMAAWTFSLPALLRAKENEPAYPGGFRLATGARNLAEAGLAEDIAFAARPDVCAAVGSLTFSTDGRPTIRLRATT